MVMERTETLLVMEYISGGSLYDFLHKTEEELTYSNAINLLCQAAEALAYLHAMSERPVIHRDVKSLNMLVDAERKNLKICDFGFVRQSRTEMTEARGTLIYMAPEVFKGKIYTDKCDVYSMGITIWEVLARQIPYCTVEYEVVLYLLKQIADGNPILFIYTIYLYTLNPLKM
ncbi:hypothetical protein AWZ03_011959 [Drosophila navojoa]|uniref:Protein kinase domain-containing protein n=1 Tax=Drosophila navojoa TaxID=7232 RepID=A0A484AYY6_DRONA|nr:hypothetical protein AWZ03_011959 [Drosophila navojoa]